MAGRIRQEDIAAVRERSPIADVVGEYLQLRPAGGGSLKGLCPFHDEKTPSFNVTPGKELWHCLAGETRVLTYDGVRPIRELAGGTHKILGADALWHDAPFYSFGVQPLMRITLSRNGVTKDIYATAEHRWFIRSGNKRDHSREVVTRSLRPGDRLSQSAQQEYERRGWVVKEVAETDRIEEVFCAVVAEGHAFVLDDNILTGNCFSCGAGGDVIKFVQDMEHLSFAETIERLAARAGIELRYEQGGYVPGQEAGQRRRLVDAHRAAQEFYADRLSAPDAGPARQFLSERGFDLADVGRFGVGYSPRAWDELTRHLRARGFTDDELTKSGLTRRGAKGLIDMFRGRLMWPIRDLTGETIAFGARKLDPNDDPKYLNTPETPLFKKASVLYGADLAKRDIARRRQAVIVEGYTDVMACHLSGVPTAVATCGTSFGEDHVKVLRRLIMDTEGSDGEVIFTFDGDAAGQKAALRAFGLEEKFATQTFVAVQPDGLDPCDLRLKHGDGAVRDLIARRVPLFEFAIRNALGKHNLDTTEGQLAALDEAAPIVARIKDTGLRGRYAVNLDRWLGLMNERFVLQRVRQHAAGGGRNGAGAGARSGSNDRNAGALRVDAAGQRRPGNGGAGMPAGTAAAGMAPYDRSDPALRVEREALKLAVQVPALCGPTFDALETAAFTVAAHVMVAGLIARCGGVASAGRPREWAARLIEDAPDDQARAFLRELAVEQVQVAGEPDEAYVDVILARVGELAVGRQITTAKARLQRMNPVEEQAEYNRLFGDLMALEQRRQVLLKRLTGG